ncbi:hypothetical protein JKP88DRAFT_251606 [Tribonema minus]|uniref:DNA polymerase delta catalytic subunit n=1 Tax=Tribonema minus TaxID=303371 RepID=A0A836CN15_9STRA|nr:hypothetical protein JKP88DRAFT_251606 [Tribonema minus]
MKFFLLHAAYEKVQQQDGEVSSVRRIQIFARTSNGDTALVTVNDWSPYGYVKVPTSELRRTETFAKQVQKKFNAEGVEVVLRKQFIGFTNLKEQKYAMFRTKRWPIWQWEAQNVIEGGVKAFHKFFDETGLRSGAWFELPDDALQTGAVTYPQSTCKRHYQCRMSQLVPRTDDTTPPKLTIMAYDLETTGLDPDQCTINEVCLIFWDTAQAEIPEIGEPGEERSVVICTQPTATMKGTNVIEVPDERALLVEMTKHIVRHDPDVLTGYNLTFDNRFLMAKAAKYKAKMTEQFSFYNAGRCRLLLPGIADHQSGHGVQRPERGYRLRPDIRGVQQCGPLRPSRRDSILLCHRRAALPPAHEALVRTCGMHGGGCCGVHELCRYIDHGAPDQGGVDDTRRYFGEWVFNTPPPAPSGGYQGATVITPTTGFYGGPTEQVVLLDFASLYPNLMRSHGVCPSRYIRDDMPNEVAASLEDGVEVVCHNVAPGKVVKLAKLSDKTDVPVFTRILTKLLDERKKVRQQMKIVTDPDELNILDKRQLAKKVACNSAYGILGTTSGMMPLPDLAAVTTYQGRMVLQVTIDIATKEYGATVVGGDTDSIFVLLPHLGPEAVPEEPDDEWRSKRMDDVFKMSDTIAEHVTRHLHETFASTAMCLEGEGVLHPLAYYKKKRYAAMLHEPGKPTKMKMRGVVAVRNDWSRLTKELAGDVLRMSIQENDPTGALAHLRDTLAKMRRGEIPSEMFVIKKQLHTYEPKTKSPHTQMAIRIRKKDPSAAPILGSKVEYVFRRGPEDISDRAYSPEEVAPNQIDIGYYFERQLLKPMSELLAPMIDGGIGKLRRLLVNEQAQQPEISAFAEGYKERIASTTVPAVSADVGSKKPRQAGLGMFGMSGGTGVSKWAVDTEKPKRKVAQISGNAKKSKQQTLAFFVPISQ